ncbi:MAG TPA: NAD(P)-dependent oxidoreductase [Candidatus Polarisedimenticolia bacterium]|nr:NAD(P)-dependent oxidoreductase [Candidatus Polarisedimenticolia bacterium]
MKVAFLGLGTMGEPMARNLLRGGADLCIWNRSAGKGDRLVDEGARRENSPAKAVEGAQACVVMVADPAALDEVLRGPSGALSALGRGAVLINMGTQSIEQIEALAADCGSAGIAFVDAPVTGSRSGAVEATLTILAGASAEDLEKGRPILAMLGKTILHVGRPGDGTRAKLVLNLIQAGMLVVWSEGLALGKRLGLSPSLTAQVLENSAGNSGLFRYKTPFLLKRDFSTNFSLKLMDKDIKLAMREAGRLGLDLPGCGTTSEVFSEAMAERLGEEDFVAIAKMAEKRAGTLLDS